MVSDRLSIIHSYIGNTKKHYLHSDNMHDTLSSWWFINDWPASQSVCQHQTSFGSTSPQSDGEKPAIKWARLFLWLQITYRIYRLSTFLRCKNIYWSNADVMLGHCLLRCPNIKLTSQLQWAMCLIFGHHKWKLHDWTRYKDVHKIRQCENL